MEKPRHVTLANYVRLLIALVLEGEPLSVFALFFCDSSRVLPSASAAELLCYLRYPGRVLGAGGGGVSPAEFNRYRLQLGSRPAIFPAIISPIGIAEVAAGDGALQTWSMRAVSRNKKSCTRVPSFITAWARMPAS